MPITNACLEQAFAQETGELFIEKPRPLAIATFVLEEAAPTADAEFAMGPPRIAGTEPPSRVFVTDQAA